VQHLLSHDKTHPERILSNPWYERGFFEPNQYQAAIDRCKNGYDSCDIFIKSLEHRVKIEEDYIAEMHKWSTKWQKEIAQSHEFGMNKRTWMASIRAGEQMASSHSDMVTRIQQDVIDKMITYKKENYEKSHTHMKKSKEFERDFEQAQKSWLKLLDKINDAKKTYQDMHRRLKRAQCAEEIIASDTDATEEQKNKAKMVASSYTKESEGLKKKYQLLIEEMNNTRPNYENSMKEILDRTHDFERKRLNQFKLLFTTLHDAIYVQMVANLTEISAEFKRALEYHNIDVDIQWWNAHYGSDTNTSWPSFEELND